MDFHKAMDAVRKGKKATRAVWDTTDPANEVWITWRPAGTVVAERDLPQIGVKAGDVSEQREAFLVTQLGGTRTMTFATSDIMATDWRVE
jgi:hypothetical protein